MQGKRKNATLIAVQFPCTLLRCSYIFTRFVYIASSFWVLISLEYHIFTPFFRNSLCKVVNEGSMNVIR